MERRLLLSGTLPSFVQPSTDANYTLDNSSGSMVLDLTSGSLAVNGDLSTATGWSNATVRLHNSAHIYFNASQTLGTLSVQGSATVTCSQGTGGSAANLLQLDSLSIASTATLDLGDNAMILYYTPSNESSDLSMVQSLLKTGYNAGAWNGSGINSTSAATDASQNTAIGYADNNDMGFTSFAGVNLPDFNQILIRYTVYGDSDLSGVVDATDFGLFAAGRSGGGTGWDFGDYNFDGNTDDTDYSIFSQHAHQAIPGSQYAPAFNLQTLPIQPNWNTPFSGDIATFTDSVNPNLSASDYVAEVYWGDGSIEFAQVTATGTPGSFRINAISPVFTSGNPIMMVMLQYADGSGYQSEAAIAGEPIDVLQLPPGVNASANALYSLSGTSGNIQLNLTAGSLAFDTNASDDSNYFQNLNFTVSGSAHAYFNAPQNFNALDIQNSAIVSVSKGSGGTNGNLLNVQSLSIDLNATLDLSDNGLIEWYDLANESAAATQMNNWLKSGYANGLWNGPGIDSTVAADDTTHATALGWIDNYGGPQYDTFDGVAMGGLNQLIVQYTLNGDADLSGTFDATDVNQYIAGREGLGTGWMFGDSNYDGTTDSTDLAVLQANMGRSMYGPTYARAFQPTGILINPTEGVPFSGDIATFTDLLNPSNTDPSIYEAQVNWGNGGFVSAQVTATSTPGSFRINALSPALTNPNAVMAVIIKYADMTDPSPTYQGRPAAVVEPITMTPAVANLTATAASTSEIDLSWTLNAPNASAIEVDRSTDGINWQLVTDSLPGNATSYSDTTGLTEATDYYYQVRAIQPVGPSAYTTPADAWTMANAPSGLGSSVISGGGGVTLSWTNNSPGAIGFTINRSDDGGATYQPVGVVDSTTTTYTDTTPPDGTNVIYQIDAMDGGGGESQPLTSDPIQLPLAPPTNLSVSTVSDTEIDLAWDNGSDVATGYIVERSENGGDFTQIKTTSGATYQDTGLNPDTSYTYRIRSTFGSLAPSDSSATQSATTNPAPVNLVLSGDSTVGRGNSYTLELGYQVLDGGTSIDYPTSVNIDWGDGNMEALNEADSQDTHTYNTRGVYTINVTATSPAGTSSAESKVVVGINPVTMGFNQDFSQSQFDEGGTVDFTASLSGDALDLLQVKQWVIDLDDGTGPQSFVPDQSHPDDQTFQHNYAHGGTTFDAAITAVTDQGLVTGDAYINVKAPTDDPNYPTNSQVAVTPTSNGGNGGNGNNGSNGGTGTGGTGSNQNFTIDPCAHVAIPNYPWIIGWGDGASDTQYSGGTDSHPYYDSGQYLVTVTDGNGDIIGGNWVRVKSSVQPILAAIPDQIVSTGDAVNVSASASQVYSTQYMEGYADWGDGTGLHLGTLQGNAGYTATVSAKLDAAGDPGQSNATLTLYGINEPDNHCGVESGRGFALDVAGSPLLIDANNDDNLDVPTLDNTPESEQQTFDDTTLPGKLISVNTGDKDGDGIPDYADGYNLFTDQSDSASPPTSDQGAGFVPITVQIPSWINPANVQLSFAYSASNPNTVTRTGSGTDDDPYVYAPADGNLRLWIKDEDTQRNPASVADGGDWIKPDESFPASDLNGTTTIYVEAVRPSTDLADDAITLTFSGSHLPPDPTGTVHLTAFGMQYDQVNSDGTISPATQPQVSQPSPIIDLSDYQLENVHFSSDFTQVIADIHLAGTVTDAASDLIAGADGTIHTIDVTLNGGNTSLAMIDLEVTKSEGSDSLLHPYAYSGSFDQTLRGVVVNAGWNLIHLSAANFYGYSGYAEASMEVNVTPDNTDITLSQDPYTAASDAQITITYTRDGQVTTDTLKQDADQPDLWVNIADTITVDTSNAGGGNETLHVTDTIRKIDDDIVFSQDTSGTMHGTFVPDPDTQDDYRNMSVSAGAVTDVTASTGGILSPIALEVLGPAELQNLLEKTTINNQDFRIVPYQGLNLLQPWESNLTVPGLDLAMLDTSPSTDPVSASLNNPPRRDGLANFAEGFGMGMLGAGVSLRDGFKSMGKAVWNVQPQVQVWHLITGQTFKENRQSIQNLKVAKGIAEVLYQAVKQNSQQVIIDMMLGNNTTINALGEQYTKAFEAVGELLQQVGNWLDNLDIDDYTFGKIEGRIVGEALTLVLTEGAGEVAELSKATILQKLLPRLLKVDELAPRTVELTQFVSKTAEGLATTKMCFVAGTLVHSLQGLKPIEMIKVGDLVLSRDEETDEQAYKPVLQTLTTHPTRLCHIHFRAQSGREERLACTGEHPFYVASLGAFVPAKQLQAGEVLTLVEGSSAQILSVTTEEALGRPFTTYNFEVADFHTYFVGLAAVWVHNVGEPCETFFSLFNDFVEVQKLDYWSAFKRVMAATKDMEGIDVALPDFAKEVFQKIYKAANGDWRKVPTAKEVYEAMGAVWNPLAFGGKGGWVGSRSALVNMQTHHTAVIQWTQKLLGRSLTQAEKDAMPAIPLLNSVHDGKNGTAAFHAFLRQYLTDGNTYPNDEILRGLQKAYSDWDPANGPQVWNVVRSYLTSMGVR